MPNEIAEQAAKLIEPIVEQMALELVDVEYLSEHGRWVLRVIADKPGGITLDDCARASREISAVIDVKDVVHHEYVLEVSSPGLNRPLKREKDFLRVIGEKIKVRMAGPVDGRRNFRGVLQDLKDHTLYLGLDRKIFVLPLKNVEKANLIYGFEGTSPARSKNIMKGTK
ncbi:MAG: ribosome maturation factor RimP [Deltaproteobacteria bacterium]|nr:ribosome maturation factor RimP [Deltaproteobacteria bacterium]